MKRNAIFLVLGFIVVFLQQGDLFAEEKPKEPAKADQEQIKKLVRQLGDEDFKKREEASNKLVEIGPPSLDQLEQALMNGQMEVHRRAQACIEKIEEADPLLRWMRALCDPRVDVAKYQQIRQRARDALTKKNQELMAKKPAGAVPPFAGLEELQKLKERTANARSYIQELKVKEGTTGLINALSDPDELVRNSAVEALVHVGKAAVPALLRGFKNKDKDGRIGSLRALVGIRPESRVLVPLLRQALDDQNEEVAHTAVWLIGNRYRVPALVSKLVEVLQNPPKGRKLQEEIVWTLGEFGSQADGAVPALLKILDDQANTATAAARALGKIKPPRPGVIRALRRALRESNDAKVRSAAATALGMIGLEAKPAIPDLLAALHGRVGDGRETFELYFSALRALERVGLEGGDAVPILVAIVTKGSSAPPMQPRPERALMIWKNEEMEICEQAIRVLGLIGPGARAALPVLKPLADSQDVVYGPAALKAMSQIEVKR